MLNWDHFPLGFSRKQPPPFFSPKTSSPGWRYIRYIRSAQAQGAQGAQGKEETKAPAGHWDQWKCKDDDMGILVINIV